MIRHGGLIALRLGGVWRGALIEGASGVGKSDLALRALDQGFRLVADDRVVTFAAGGRLYGRAPETLAGLIEVRGLGVVAAAAVSFAEVALVVRCVEAPEGVERLPESRFERISGVDVPVFDLWPREPAAPAKIRRMMQSLGVQS
ncbi:serine kinase of HPr protein (carbohydrate metabolism regulator) [Caulobacter sp. BE264]|uniref:HPr kinase/phosphatase C-terminal domain-containing protein n=1 Tax=Caulobacter sp. BE264 TaxID=2817724 RepID=UPI00285AC75C|nr:HPr kinase/phosphorylase [Caulobacter sp. BE264]MDR7232474.1 serine kinase of HPr protein (carbohydrate metabolism regulator) [Caulobacter sp. BE264]